MQIHSVMFHHFFDEKHPKGQGAISAEQLADMINEIGPSRIIGADEWLDASKRGDDLKDAIALTFDDGLLCQFEIALPVLQDFNIRAFWFVNSAPLQGNVGQSLEMYRYFRTTCFVSMEDFYAEFQSCALEEYGDIVEQALANFDPDDYLQHAAFYTAGDRIFRYLRDIVLGPDRYHRCMTSMFRARRFVPQQVASLLWLGNDQLKMLIHAGHVIGLHSHTHPTRIAAMSYGEQRNEYRRNLKHILAVTGIVPRAMSHPCNSYNEDSLNILNDMGIEVGFRADGALANAAYSPLEYPRTDHAVLVKYMGL